MKREALLKVSRVEGITDGLFATAMTILLFSVQLPEGTTVVNLPTVLTTKIFEIIVIYAGSFIILGTLWVGSNILHGFLQRVNRQYLWLNILYLIPAGIVPFSTSLLIDYPRNTWCITFYVLNLLVSSIFQICMWRCGVYYKLYNSAYRPCVHRLITKRMSVPVLIYIISLIIAPFNTSAAFAILFLQPVFNIMPGRIDRYISKRELGFK